MKSLNIFYFDNDLGRFDKFNPRFVMEQANVLKILTQISEKPACFYDANLLSKKLKINLNNTDKALQLLNDISLIKFKREKIYLNFPFFNNADVKKLQKIIRHILDLNFSSIINCLSQIEDVLKIEFPNNSAQQSIYHILCGKVFDGGMFDYLEKNKIVIGSFPQKDNRDYLVVGYQNSNYCNRFNAKLFCSFNNARFKKSSLSSFGNASGERFDYFRYFKLREKNQIYGKFKQIHNDFLALTEEDIMKNSFDIIIKLINKKQIEENIFFENLKRMKYISKKGEFIVPVFDVKKLTKIINQIISIIGPKIIEIFTQVKKQVLQLKISAINHKVKQEQIFNEIWHMFFGLLNNLLIAKKFAAKPKFLFNQGSYLKCIYLDC